MARFGDLPRCVIAPARR